MTLAIALRCPKCQRPDVQSNLDMTQSRCLVCGHEGTPAEFVGCRSYETHSPAPFTAADGFQVRDASGRVIALLNQQIPEYQANLRLFLASAGMLDAAARLIQFMTAGCEPWEIYNNKSWKDLCTSVQKAQ